MRRRVHRRTSRAITVLGLAGALVACSGDPPANDLEVGDCVEDETTLNDSGLLAIDCGDDHTIELIARFDVDGDEFPGEDELRAQGEEGCTGDRFEEYVGAPYDPESDVLVTPVVPSADSWEDADDRTILCFAHAPDLAETDQSVEDSAEG